MRSIFMKVVLVLLTLVLSVPSFAQFGPGGVGLVDGTSGLKLWFRTDSGVRTTGAVVDTLINQAGVDALTIAEAGAQRPTLVTNAVNGYDEVSFSGSNRLRTGTSLTTSNFITNQASSFVVCRADNTTQTSCVYTTDPLVGTTRFSCHVPWSNVVYYDMGTCCGNDARIQVGSLTALNAYSVWSYQSDAASGKQLYRNGNLLQNRAGVSNYSSHATHRFNLGGNTSGTNGFVGDVTEIVIYNTRVNNAQRIIIENYLAAKYGLTMAANDVYLQDNVANGNFDHDVAGIGRVNASNIHDDAQGTGVVRVLNPSGLGNNEFLMWGHDGGALEATEFLDVPSGVEARLDRVWRFSEVNASGAAVDVGSVDIRWDLTGLGPVTTTDLRLLVDADNDGNFDDETPISGASDLGGNVYAFTGITAISNGVRMTLGTLDAAQTPLPIELLSFTATPEGRSVQLHWSTATEVNNAYFEVQRSPNGVDWINIGAVSGAGNSVETRHYNFSDQQPVEGVSYYKIKQVDFDETYSFSSVIQVTLQPIVVPQSLVVFPNPVSDFLHLNDAFSASDILSVISMKGDIMDIKVVETEDEKTRIDVSRLPDGTYILNTALGNVSFVKQSE